MAMQSALDLRVASMIAVGALAVSSGAIAFDRARRHSLAH